MPTRAALALLLLLIATAPGRADQPALMDWADLHAGLALDARAWEGRQLSLEGVLVGDFFRDLYLADPEGRPLPGLRVTSGEHTAELGDLVRVTGLLRLEADGPALAVADPLRDLLPLREAGVRRQKGWVARPGDLAAEPAVWADRLVELQGLELRAIRRDDNGVPWLAVVADEGGELGVELSDGQHPVLVEGARLAGVRGIFARRGEYWNLRPRSREDWLRVEGGERGHRPLPREPVFGGRTSEGKAGGLWGKQPAPRLLLDEICYDAAEPGEGEGGESFAVVNVGERKQRLDGWAVTDNEGLWRFPPGSVLAPGATLHVARSMERFTWEFGFAPDLALDRQPTPGDSLLILDNGGDELVLINARGRVVDAVVWEAGWAEAQPGWSGAAAAPFRFNDYVPAEGQVLWRKRSLESGRRLDTNAATDWIGDPVDPRLGMSVAYPGWDRERFLDTARCEGVAEVTALVSPDNSFAGVRDFLRSATASLEIETYLFTHAGLADELVAAMERGVRVTMLLDGEVFGARGGTYDVVRAVARRIDEHPSGRGGVFFWRNGDDPRHTGMDADLPDRYNHCHQKFILADRRRLLVSSDNFTQSSLPDDDPADGTSGARGAFLITDAPCVLERAIAIWEADFDPQGQRDIHRYVPREGLAESPPRPGSARAGYLPVQAEPFSARERVRVELSQSPDNALRPDRGYLGHLREAGRGDLVLVEQQYERAWWGYGQERAPNPRLDAYLEAARRGARVRVLLSGSDDEEGGAKNRLTAERFNTIALEEGIDLRIALGSLPGDRPGRGAPIHNKMLLVRAGDAHWCHVGSANGSETASRMNRELGLSIDSQGLFAYLAEVFTADWLRAGGLLEETPAP
jgi:phosphatidylserine/phosphatidylglycerophosphate/cardiolipin synthase-like enzyme